MGSHSDLVAQAQDGGYYYNRSKDYYFFPVMHEDAIVTTVMLDRSGRVSWRNNNGVVIIPGPDVQSAVNLDLVEKLALEDAIKRKAVPDGVA